MKLRIKIPILIVPFILIPLTTIGWIGYEKLVSNPNNESVFISVFFAVMIAVILTASAIMIALRQYIFTPLKQLEQLATDIGEDKYREQPELYTNDELGTLARSLDKMVKKLHQSRQMVEKIAFQDNLTGLANRAFFTTHLMKSMANAKRHKLKLTLLFLDLDNFKKVNDSHGHLIGDELLKLVASRLLSCIRKEDAVTYLNPDEKQDLIARIGGDEFIILLQGLERMEDAAIVAGRIIHEIEKPFSIQHSDHYIGTSIGITNFPGDGSDPETLIKNADIAMYHAKERGKNNFQFFSEQLQTAITDRLKLEEGLRKALLEQQLQMVYQPQVEITTGKIVGFEALIRWNHPQEGYISPACFIPLAEENGMIVPLTEWILTEVAGHLREWRKGGVPLVPVSVNISSLHLTKELIVPWMRSTLEKFEILPSQLGIEITETHTLDHPETTLEAISLLRDMGVSVALDDFGTGYSSLSHLCHFPIDHLKIDRSFILSMLDKEEAKAVVTAIISMAHALQMQVIAEGVEEHNQLELLRKANCDIVQGYLYSKPVLFDAALKLMQAGSITT